MGITPMTHNHTGNSFDFLRVGAAWSVLYSHSYPVVGLQEPEPIVGHTFGGLAVALFFAISGFLVCQSWLRDPSKYRFAARRLLRIMPGLLAVVLITTFVIGPIFTTLKFVEYISDIRTWIYLPSTLLFLSVPALPGLFELNVYPNVNNGSLWTLRYEVLMYACLAFLGSLLHENRLKAACVLSFLCFGTLWIILTLTGSESYQIPFIWRAGTELYGDRIGYLGAFFFAGCCSYLYFDRIPLSGTVALVLAFCAVLIPNKIIAMSFLWLAIPYIAITFAYRAPKLFQKLNGHDYSYGIYIYAFPVQQIVSQHLPQSEFRWLISLTTSTVITVFLAVLSWRLVEKPALSLKDRLINQRESRMDRDR